MSIIAPDTLGIYSIFVVTPSGVRFEVDGYNLYRYSRVTSLADHFRKVLGREHPVANDPLPMQDMWRTIFEFGVDPSTCEVQVAQRAEDGDLDAVNGWKTLS